MVNMVFQPCDEAACFAYLDERSLERGRRGNRGRLLWIEHGLPLVLVLLFAAKSKSLVNNLVTQRMNSRILTCVRRFFFSISWFERSKKPPETTIDSAIFLTP